LDNNRPNGLYSGGVTALILQLAAVESHSAEKAANFVILRASTSVDRILKALDFVRPSAIFKMEPMRDRMSRRKLGIKAVAFSVPKKPIQWEVYRPIKGSPGAFIGIVEAPDETSALKTAIEEFGIINPEHQNRVFVRRVPGDDD
jgi:hypothetical protein